MAWCRVLACFTVVFVAYAVAMRPTIVSVVTIGVVVTARARIEILIVAADFGFQEVHLFLQLLKTSDDVIGDVRQFGLVVGNGG